jgi:hypothetical protein
MSNLVMGDVESYKESKNVMKHKGWLQMKGLSKSRTESDNE